MDMRIEKWKYEDKEVEVPILDEEEMETNDDDDELDNTMEMTFEEGNTYE